MFVPTYHKKSEEFNLHKGFLRIRNSIVRDCEFSDLAVKIKMKHYFEIVVLLLTKAFCSSVINKCVVYKISYHLF